MSRRKIRRHRDVATDIVDQAAYIARDNMDAALRYWDAVQVTMAWLLTHPGAGHRRDFDDPHLANIRSWPVSGFERHLILYEIDKTGIYVLAILHGARDLPTLLKRRR